jgi:hypothetical protein
MPEGLKVGKSRIFTWFAGVTLLALLSLFPCGAFAQQKPAVDVSATTDSGQKPRLFPPLVWGQDDEWKLQPGGDVRVRWESRRNYDMDRQVGDNDNLYFLRTRLDFELTHRSMMRVFLELLDARSRGFRVDPLQQDEWDIHQLFAELRPAERSPWSLRLGRQEFSFGEKRLVDASSWSNLIRSFDGARLRYEGAGLDVNAFVAQQVIFDTIRDGMIVTGRGRPKNHEWFYGVYATSRRAAPHEFDLYFLGLRDCAENRTFPSPVLSESGRPGTTDMFTVGSRARGPLWKRDGCGTLGYGLEVAGQFGHRSGDDIESGMVHADLNHQWKHPWKPKIVLEGNGASGDRRLGDGEVNRFSPLFGTTHTPYGIIDFTRLQNLREIAVTGCVEPAAKLKAQLEWHGFWLDSRTDAWLNSSGRSLGRDATGQSGREPGQEICFILTCKLSHRLTLESGAARFLEGNFAEKQGRRDGASLIYLQSVFSF